MLILAQTARAARLRRGRARPGLSGDSPLGGLDPQLGLAQPVRRRRRGADRRAAAGRVRLLGLGVARSTSPRRPATRRRRPGARRSSPPSSCWSPTSASRSRSSPSPAPSTCRRTPTRRRRSSRCCPREVMGGWDWVVLARRGHRGDRLHPDDDPPGVPDRRCRWPAGTRCPGGSRTSRRATAPPTSPRGGSASSPASGSSLVSLISENALFDSITALSLLIAFYYALTGIACAVYYRRQLTRSVEDVPAHRGRPGHRCAAADLAAGAVDPRHRRPGELLHRAGLARGGPAAGDRRRDLRRRRARDAGGGRATRYWDERPAWPRSAIVEESADEGP